MRHQVHPNQVGAWKRQAIEGPVEVFSKGAVRRGPRSSRQDRRAGFFIARARSVRCEMVVRDHPAPSLSRRSRRLSVGRSSLYYEPKGESAETLAMMRRIDGIFLKCPLFGARRMALHLRCEGVRTGRRRAGRLMRLMIYRAPGLPISAAGSGNRTAEPRLVRRYHLNPGAAWLPLP